MALKVKRIISELKDFHRSRPSNIFIDYDESDISQIEALIIGPADTPYENSFFRYKITYNNTYPLNPPKVIYTSSYGKYIHPNHYANGKLCLSILGTWSGPSWIPTMNISTILLNISAILDETPLKCEPGFANADEKKVDMYNEMARYSTLETSLRMANDEKNQTFKEIMQQYIAENYKWYRRTIKAMLPLNNKIVGLPVYGNKEKVNIDLLKNRLKPFKAPKKAPASERDAKHPDLGTLSVPSET